MGVFSFFRNLWRKNKEGSILLLGLDNSGKTSILRQLCDEEIADVTPTQGFSIKSIQVQGIKLKVWDMGGQQTTRFYWRQYFHNAEVLIFVIDSADLNRTREAKDEFTYLMEEDKLSGIPVLVFANKQDLVGALTCTEIAILLNLEELRDRRWHIQACSALSGEGLLDGLKWVIQQLCS